MGKQYQPEPGIESFSLFNKTPIKTTNKRGKSSKSTATSSSYPGGGYPDVPDVTGLSRLNAISILNEAGITYMLTYVTAGSSPENNDTIYSMSAIDGVAYIEVYQYTNSGPVGNLLLSVSLVGKYFYLQTFPDPGTFSVGKDWPQGAGVLFANYAVPAWGGTLVQDGNTAETWLNKYVKFNGLSSVTDGNYYKIVDVNDYQSTYYLTYLLEDFPYQQVSDTLTETVRLDPQNMNRITLGGGQPTFTIPITLEMYE